MVMAENGTRKTILKMCNNNTTFQANLHARTLDLTHSIVLLQETVFLSNYVLWQARKDSERFSPVSSNSATCIQWTGQARTVTVLTEVKNQRNRRYASLPPLCMRRYVPSMETDVQVAASN
jgi:hypothetical protein